MSRLWSVAHGSVGSDFYLDFKHIYQLLVREVYLHIMHAMKRTHGKNNTDGVCRLCSSNSGIIVLNIFDGEGKKRRVLSLINACLPVKVC